MIFVLSVVYRKEADVPISYFRGHKIVYDSVKRFWVYEDTGERAEVGVEVRPCKKCGRTFEGSNPGDADPCLGELPGVDSACCGHGERDRSYIRFNNGVVVKGFIVDDGEGVE